ncbi:tyrosine-type recombinase/integrase [Arsenicicoccus dermatophilus]|uniref:tyrosine-type recombinase/integrase n=1 Tax=Arsenicicoccus dermatophilus TaxID=1076331 RepID=UPI00391759E7
MSVQRITRGGVVRYRARVKHGGREVATRVFDRKRDAESWERDQVRSLQAGEWFDPRRGRLPLEGIAADWLRTLETQKRKSRRAHESAWKGHIQPRFGRAPLSSITAAQVSAWAGDLVASGLAPSTASRYLATLRSLLAYAVQDGRIAKNPAQGVKVVTGGRKARREGQFLGVDELHALAAACRGRYGDLVIVLGLCGLRWGEVAGLQVGDVITSPGPGLRLRRTVIADSGTGALYEETLKGYGARTVPLPAAAREVVERWAAGRSPSDWLFAAPRGGALAESNWRRTVGWSGAIAAIGRPTMRPHDLRHTAASLWLGAGADPKVVQRVLGHATATMTMDLYGHLIDRNLWAAADLVGGTKGAPEGTSAPETTAGDADGDAA